MVSTGTPCPQCGKPMAGLPCPHCRFGGALAAPEAAMSPPRLHLLKPLENTARWTVRLLLLQALTLLFTVSMMIAVALETDGGHRFGTMTTFQEINAFNCVQSIAWLAAVIQFLVWQYRLRVNCELLGVQGMEQSPGMGVAWWFIPIANLFMPYMVLQELWRAGLAAQTAAGGRVAWRQTPACPVIKTYWIVKIANIVIPFILQFDMLLTFMIPGRGSPASAMENMGKTVFATTIASNTGQAALCFMEVFIVERLTRRYHALLAQRQPPSQAQQLPQ